MGISKWLFILLLAPSAYSAPEFLGGSDGAGGDDRGLEFVAAFREAMSEVRQKSDPYFAPVLKLDVDEVVKSTTVVVVDEELPVKASGSVQKSVATSYPKQRLVLVNNERWQALMAEADAKKRNSLALHEFLVIEEIETTGDYPYSSKYLYGDLRDFRRERANSYEVASGEECASMDRAKEITRTTSGRLHGLPYAAEVFCREMNDGLAKGKVKLFQSYSSAEAEETKTSTSLWDSLWLDREDFTRRHREISDRNDQAAMQAAIEKASKQALQNCQAWLNAVNAIDSQGAECKAGPAYIVAQSFGQYGQSYKARGYAFAILKD